MNKIEEKLAKMLALQKSAEEIGSEAEAATFAAKIQSMLIKYELELSDLDKTETQSVDVDEEIVDVGALTLGNEGKWVQYLINGIARSNTCKVILSKKYQGDLSCLLVGHMFNREAVKYIVNELTPKLRNMARYSFKFNYRGSEKRNTYIRGFLMGAAQEIGNRLWDKYTSENYELAGAADLVLNKQAALDNYMNIKYGQLKLSRGSTLKGHGGAQAGRRAGASVTLNKEVGRGGSRLLN